MKFDCPRTCPLFNEEWCRFRPILDKIGPVKVNSHTATIKVELTDPSILEGAIKAMGGTWLGQGSHRLFGGHETGYGFKLPDWNYPLVLKENGTLAYDDYNGSWGNVNDLERLKTEYATLKVVKEAEALGWQWEKLSTGETVIYHPSGGTITVNGLSYENSGFHGEACHEARKQLGLNVEDIQAKSEINETVMKIQEQQ